MKRRQLVVALVVCLSAALVILTGCGDTAPAPTSLELGKACADAGGSWRWSEWSGYHCEFP